MREFFFSFKVKKQQLVSLFKMREQEERNRTHLYFFILSLSLSLSLYSLLVRLSLLKVTKVTTKRHLACTSRFHKWYRWIFNYFDFFYKFILTWKGQLNRNLKSNMISFARTLHLKWFFLFSFFFFSFLIRQTNENKRDCLYFRLTNISSIFFFSIFTLT